MLLTQGQVPPARHRELAAFVETHRTTETMFRDLDRLGLAYKILAMDEFTIDIVVPLPDGLALVYDTT